MERLLFSATIRGHAVEIAEQLHAFEAGGAEHVLPGLKVAYFDGVPITPAALRAFLLLAGRADVIDAYSVPA